MIPVVRSKNKISTLDALALTLISARAAHKTIVHCHGVFDLLHIGHIRHLERAKTMGDVLVVTVTPDRYVNKGPHRPVFSEALRLEAIAALDCVDYACVNMSANAVPAILQLRPDCYVKGSDYRDANQDMTGGILLEQEAVESVGGRLAFTHDITFSSSNLINRHMSVFAPSVSEYLADFARRHPASEVIGYLDTIRTVKTLVIGEAIIDEYQYCDAIGKSSKEPMLAVRLNSIEKFPGGILAVANHVANFTHRTKLITFLGDAHSQEDFITQKLEPAIDKTFLYRENSPTIVKRRFVESYFFTKLLEVYEISDGPLPPANDQRLCDVLNETVGEYDAVIVVDFGHGMLSRRAIGILCEKAKFLAVNAQSNAGNFGYHTVARYPRADYVSIAEGEIRLEARDKTGDLREMTTDLIARLRCSHAAVTRGKVGCLFYGKDEGFYDIPAFAGQVIDRMGAGDAFLSITALCVAKGVPAEVAGFIGNAVGAQAVATVGHRSFIERVALMKQVESLLK